MYCSNNVLRIVPKVGSAAICTALTTFLKLCQKLDQLLYVLL